MIGANNLILIINLYKSVFFLIKINQINSYDFFFGKITL